MQNIHLGIDIKTQITLNELGGVETVVVAIPMLKDVDLTTFIIMSLGEEPEISSSLISLKDASSSMTFSDAANNFGKLTSGGIAFLSFAVKKSPSGICLNRKAP